MEISKLPNTMPSRKKDFKSKPISNKHNKRLNSRRGTLRNQTPTTNIKRAALRIVATAEKKAATTKKGATRNPTTREERGRLLKVGKKEVIRKITTAKEVTAAQESLRKAKAEGAIDSKTCNKKRRKAFNTSNS